jgi:hypothetical protein
VLRCLILLALLLTLGLAARADEAPTPGLYSDTESYPDQAAEIRYFEGQVLRGVVYSRKSGEAISFEARYRPRSQTLEGLTEPVGRGETRSRNRVSGSFHQGAFLVELRVPPSLGGQYLRFVCRPEAR